MNEHWTFHIEKNLAPELREQAVRLAARVPEGFSRRDCPKLWALADRRDAETDQRRGIKKGSVL